MYGSKVEQRGQGLGASMSTFASHLFAPSEYAAAAYGKVVNGPADAPHAELPGFAATRVRPCQALVSGHMITLGLDVIDLLAARHSTRRWTNNRHPHAEGGEAAPGAGACCRKAFEQALNGV